MKVMNHYALIISQRHQIDKELFLLIVCNIRLENDSTKAQFVDPIAEKD